MSVGILNVPATAQAARTLTVESVTSLIMRLYNTGRTRDAITAGTRYLECSTTRSSDFYYVLATAYLRHHDATGREELLVRALEMREQARLRSPYWHYTEKRQWPQIHALDSPEASG
ncbi:hypothetical protein CYG49_04120 [Candidatus Saccharibacteria bacterium]|nr:MAG: hypothetical protein CYG49_04120 [Candidatus Saccharibacteria bacterium]